MRYIAVITMSCSPVCSVPVGVQNAGRCADLLFARACG